MNASPARPGAPAGVDAPPAVASDLAAALGPVRDRLEADLQRQIDLAGSHRNAAKALEVDLKALSSGLAIISEAQTLAVSLLYKRAGSGAYIKGRCWWNGRQREVQIGSIRAVLAALPEKVAAPYSGKTPAPGWNEIRGDEPLMTAIKEIGRRKLRELIGRQLRNEFSGGLDSFGPVVAEAASAEPLARGAPAGPQPPDGSGNWYAHWRAHWREIDPDSEAGS